jgi:predicted transcriptional regulator
MLPTAQEFRYLRKKAGLTQKELASRAGLSQPLIARIEHGDIDTKLSTAKKILDVIKSSESKKEKSLNLRDYMVSPVMYCKSADPIKRVVEKMEDNNISQMPVMDGGIAVGSVTDTQLVQVLSKKGARSARRKIADIMAKPFPELEINSPIDKAVDLLTKNSAVLITRNKHIAGIVTKADVLRLLV